MKTPSTKALEEMAEVFSVAKYGSFHAAAANGYIAGYQAAQSLANERESKLVEALKWYADQDKWTVVRDFVGDKELQGLELFEVEYSLAATALKNLASAGKVGE